jgi:SagB-type dehydrogenase family enzyme
MIMKTVIELPEPRLKGEISVEEAIRERRSKRRFKDLHLTLNQLSQIMWAAQGITNRRKRASPSAGETYPLEIYVTIGDVEGIMLGLYHYIPKEHSIERIIDEDIRDRLMEACLRQISVTPICIVICAVYERTTMRYGERGMRYVHMEVGHVGENVYLQARSMGLDTVAIGAFHDDEVSKVLKLPEKHKPLYLMPVGYSF